MTVYRIGNQWGDGTHPAIMDKMIADGWLVPVDGPVYRKCEPCETTGQIVTAGPSNPFGQGYVRCPECQGHGLIEVGEDSTP